MKRTCGQALLLVVALAPPAAHSQERSADSTRVDVGVYARRHGLLLPFARFDGERWEGLWPDASDVGVGLENVERLRERWVVARSLASVWYLAPEAKHAAEAIEVEPAPIIRETICGVQAALAAKRASVSPRLVSPWVIAAHGNVAVSPIQAVDPRSRLAQQVLSSHHVRTDLDPQELRVAREWRERVLRDQSHDGDAARLAPREGVRFWMQKDADLGPLLYLERERQIEAGGQRIAVRGHAMHWAGSGSGVTWAEVDDGTMPVASRWLPLGAIAGSSLDDWIVVEERAAGTRLVLYRLRPFGGRPPEQMLVQPFVLGCARS